MHFENKYNIILFEKVHLHNNRYKGTLLFRNRAAPNPYENLVMPAPNTRVVPKPAEEINCLRVNTPQPIPDDVAQAMYECPLCSTSLTRLEIRNGTAMQHLLNVHEMNFVQFRKSDMRWKQTKTTAPKPVKMSDEEVNELLDASTDDET